MNPDVDKFMRDSTQWKREMEKLRGILLQTKLEEYFKWRLPCYSHNGSNVVIIQPMKAFLGLMFFKGSLLKDPKRVLISNGPNSQAGRRFEFGSVQDVAKLSSTLKAYIKEAIAIEESGQRVKFKRSPGNAPEELKRIFARNPKLKKAFDSLTPGRQRAYLVHFSGAKQSSTRQSRIEKCIPGILAGKGLNDR